MRRYLLFALVLVALVLLAGMTSLSNAQPADPTSQFTTRHPGDVSLLTGPSEAEPLAIALTYLHDHAAGLGLTPADLAGLALSNQYRDTATGTSHIYLIQRHAGIELFNGLISAHVAADGSLISLTSRLIGALAEAVNSTSPAVSPEQAATAAAAALDLAPERPVSLLVAAAGPDKRILLSDGGFSAAPIPGRLVYYPTAAGPRLAWELQIESLDGRHFWLAFVDAVSGQMLDQIDLVIHDDFGPAAGSQVAEIGPAAGFGPDTSPPDSYEVFAMPSEYPDDGPRVIVTNPAHPIASPFGWHDTDGAPGPEFTLTQGNNVSAYQDQDTDMARPTRASSPTAGRPGLHRRPGAPGPDPGPADLQVNAAITNLFYWNNIIHDVFYMYGFDEVSGNFQVNNYGNGGLGNDDVRAEGQDGGGTNNANFLTLPDGQRPRMQMYLWTLTTPRRDGDLENSIIVHEYGHGISIRLTGGPNNVSCLNNSEQMGEGWSDWLALVLTAKASDTATTLRGIGTYVLGQPTNGVGIRPAPYTTDMTVNDYTYGDLPAWLCPTASALYGPP
jgi:extracellular elastinolytic metalloproteinase